MIFKYFICIVILAFSFHASAQMALEPSNDGDDAGALTPEFMDFLTDSGRVDGNVRIDFWKEYKFSAFKSSRRRAVHYDSMLQYESTQRYLQFYKLEGEYLNGKKEGEWRTYVCYKKQLPLRWRYESKVNYVDGQRQGWEQVFNKRGDFVGKKYYSNDLEDSTHIFYSREGVVSSTTQYKKGKMHGKSFFYDQSGSIILEMFYRDGQRVGSIVYPSNGDSPLLDGEHNSYHENGKIKSISHYAGGELNGVHKTFYPEGNQEREMSFVRGAIDGVFKEYFNNGQLKYERIYNEGRMWQVIQTFNKNGKPLPPGTLKDGAGSVLTYTDNGKLISTAEYKNGILQQSNDD